jgi:hypothetical protein
MSEQRTLLYDLEIAPLLGYAYEVWEANIIKVVRQPYIMSFAWKWLGEKHIGVCSLPDFPATYEDDPHNDHCVALKLHTLLNAADIVVAHNATKFDNKVAAARFMDHGFGPPAPFKTVDTLTAARKYFRFGNNGLDKLCGRLGIGEKTKDRHHDLWPLCLEGDRVAWAQMAEYNKRDVELLEGLYLTLRPYMTTHPNAWGDGCPRCGGADLQSRGTARTNAGVYRRFQCQDCGAWSRERLADKTAERPELVSAT